MGHGVRTLPSGLLLAAALLLPDGFCSPASAGPGLETDRIVFGQAAALEGPAASLGQGMRLGIRAAFEEVNRLGGVRGRKLELISKDDSYEPGKSITATEGLIEQAFALIGPVGTPTSKATQPIATKAGVPFIAPLTGAEFLRNAKLGNVVNVRATYGAETERLIKHLTANLGFRQIAILYQNDAFGRDGLAGVQAAMRKRNMELVASGTYTRNTTAVKTALIQIRRAKPEAVVMVGAYAPIATFIKVARSIDFTPVFATISFVGSEALARELGPAGEGVIISQVVPLPFDDTIPLVQRYQAALKALDPKAKPDFISLEGYVAGSLAIMVLEQMDDPITREGFLDTVWRIGSFDLGGVTLTYGPENNRGMDEVFLTVIGVDGSFRPIETVGM